jgi:deazaflavin-dependent oxidoreductase (nitroreductase family)
MSAVVQRAGARRRWRRCAAKGIHHETTHECFHCIECVAVPRERRADDGKDGRCADPSAYDDRARSRRERTVPVLYLEDAGRFVIVASLAGAPRHPAWFLNLEANPRVRLQVRSRRFAATARRASVEEKAQLWPRLVAMYPAYEGYQNRTTRDIPVVIATPA